MERETMEIAAMQRRMLRAWVRRLQNADLEDLGDFAEYVEEVEASLQTAITNGRREIGWSWAEIGRVFGVTRQAAQQRWGGTQ